MARTDGHFRLRLPDDIREKVKASAERNRRSMTGEMIFHLAKALGDEGKATTGEGFADTAPAVAPNETALQGGPFAHG